MVKKILLTAASIIVISHSAQAKTEGYSISLSQIKTLHDYPTMDYTLMTSGRELRSSKVSYGGSLSRAFNFDNVFVEGELFYDHNNTYANFFNYGYIESGYTGPYYNGEEIHLKYSMGAKLNIGYDFNDKFALYGIIGYSENRYNQISWENYSKLAGYTGEKEITSTRSITDESLVTGIGAKYVLNEKIDLSASYELSQFFSKINRIRDYFNATTGTQINHYKVIRLKASYKF